MRDGWSQPSSDLDQRGSRGELVRLRSLRVLVASSDRRFRAVTAMLIAQRGCAIFTAADTDCLGEMISRERIDVVVVDGDAEEAERSAAMASAEGFAPCAAIVAVADGLGQSPRGRPNVARWGPFEQLFGAIEDAERHRGAFVQTDSSTWPPSARRRERG